MNRLFPLLLVVLLIGCGDSATTPSNGCDDERTFEASPTLEIGGDRAAKVYVPSDYDPAGCYPLLILLHGFGADSTAQNSLFGLSRVVDDRQFVLVTPDGTVNEGGNRFWNATPACCAGDEVVDDVGYISSLIEEAQQTYNVDHNRVYLFGHSNGGFMSFRMACDASELITGIASLAGATFDDPADCQPDEPVSVLAIHGTADDTILYEGSPDAYPGAVETTERHAALIGCNPAVTTPGAARLDLVAGLPGDDTDVVSYRSGCAAGTRAELWTTQGGPHIPLPPSDSFTPLVLDWLFARSR